MHVRQITTLDELESLAPQWRSLAQGRPFLGPEWLIAWWRHFGLVRGRTLSVIVVCDDQNEPVAIAPLFREASLLHGPTLRFLGSGEVCSEYLSIPCQEGWQRPAAEAIADYLTGAAAACSGPTATAWESLRLESVSANDTTVQLLCEALAQRGGATHSHEAPNCWRVDLPESWEEYLAMLSKSHRKRVRRLERAYFDTGRAKQVTATTPAQWEQGFRILVDLHARRWAARGEAGVFDNVAMHAFHRAATAALLTSNQLRLSWLEIDGQPVAVEYSLVGGGILHAYQSGMDPEAGEHEPGTLTLIATFRAAIVEGLSAIDFLRGDEPYKQHWRAEPRGNREVRVLANRWRGRVRHTVWQKAKRAKSWLRAGRNKFRAMGRTGERPADAPSNPALSNSVVLSGHSDERQPATARSAARSAAEMPTDDFNTDGIRSPSEANSAVCLE